jgi:uncharacterized protein (DUF4415 family)
MSDKETDFSDAPKLNEAFWQNAQPNSISRPTKKSNSVRIDADVVGG